jgi:hypothetical protein
MKILRWPADRTIAVTEPWTCPTCNQAVATSYCPTCGERPLHAHDLSLRGLISQVTQACTNIDGPLLRSLRSLLTRPGFLTEAYLQGQRKPYTLPLQLFLIANVVFFATQSLTGEKIFSTPLAAHLHNDIWGGFARWLVALRLEARHTTLDLYAPVFDQAVAVNAKSLIILMVPPFSLLPALLFYRMRRPFVAHVVFSLHFYAFLLLFLCLSLIVAGVDVLFGGRGLLSETFDHALSIAELLGCAIYLHIATGIVYSATGAARMVKVALLVMAAAGIFLGYRFALLLITLFTT